MCEQSLTSLFVHPRRMSCEQLLTSLFIYGKWIVSSCEHLCSSRKNVLSSHWHQLFILEGWVVGSRWHFCSSRKNELWAVTDISVHPGRTSHETVAPQVQAKSTMANLDINMAVYKQSLTSLFIQEEWVVTHISHAQHGRAPTVLVMPSHSHSFHPHLKWRGSTRHT